jgi:hypothetical protein
MPYGLSKLLWRPGPIAAPRFKPILGRNSGKTWTKPIAGRNARRRKARAMEFADRHCARAQAEVAPLSLIGRRMTINLMPPRFF